MFLFVAILVALVVGALLGWAARGNGRGAPAPGHARCAPPYDWAAEELGL